MEEFRYDTQLLIEGCQLDEDALADEFRARFARGLPYRRGRRDGDEDTLPHERALEVLRYCASLGEIFDIVVEDMVRQSRGLKG